MIKRVFKLVLAAICYYSGIIRIFMFFRWGRSGNIHPIILTYHRVLDTGDEEVKYTQPGLIVSPMMFEAQMIYLKNNFDMVPLSEYAESISQSRLLPNRAVIITFDDGWRDNYSNAFPVLKRLNIPATIFLTADYIDSNRELWFMKIGRLLSSGKISEDILARVLKSHGGAAAGEISSNYGEDVIEKLKHFDPATITILIDKMFEEADIDRSDSRPGRNMLEWNEIKLMGKSEIEFGSHGLSHSILTNISREKAKHEIVESKLILEKAIGESVISFAYPNGNYNDEVRNLVRDAGYGCAVTTNFRQSGENQNDYFALKRIGISNGTSAGPLGGFSRSLLMFGISGLGYWLNNLLGKKS